MHRIDGPGATVDNKFTEGNPTSGVPATVVTGPWLNDVQEELLSLLTAAAITPVKGTQNQVLSSLRKLAPGITSSVRNGRMYIPAPAGGPTFTADEIIVSSGIGGLNYKLSNFSKAINGSGTGVGGMDVGIAPSSGFVAIYAIYNPNAPLSGSNPALLGVNATAAAQPEVYGGANMPAGYTASALVSVWATTPGSAFAAGFQIDRTAYFAPVVALTTSTQQLTATLLAVPGVPRNAKAFSGSLLVSTTTASALSCGVQGTATGFGGTVVAAQNNTLIQGSVSNVPIIAAQQTYYLASAGAGTMTFTFVLTNYTF